MSKTPETSLARWSAPLQRPFSALLDWVYPRLCLACSTVLPASEQHFCLTCQVHLPETDTHRQLENEFTDRFQRRLPQLVTAVAYYHFRHENTVRHLVHQIKYNDQREAAQVLGRIYGATLRQVAALQDVTAIVPVPMHPKKAQQRGYNQATYWAKGIAEALEIPVWEHALRKTRMTDSQTHRTRIERLQNVENAFVLSRPIADWQHQHIIIADDVMTTGATLETCAATICTASPTTRISFVTLALAQV